MKTEQETKKRFAAGMEAHRLPEDLPPVTPESARKTIEKASRVLEEGINVFYRGKGRAVPEKLLNTLAACGRVLGR